MSVLAVAELAQGAIRSVSLEAVSAARQFGRPVSAAVIGEHVELPAKELAAHDLAAVWRVEHPLLSCYSADGFTLALEALVRRTEPHCVVFPHTYQTRDYAPKLAARFGRPLVNDVARVRMENGEAILERQLFQGRIAADVRLQGPGPHFVSIQAGAYRAGPAFSGAVAVELFVPELEAASIRTRSGEPFRQTGQSVDLSAAQAIVAVGRGIRDKENLALAEALAAALGAELAASRPVCDNGWLPLERQVGSSGQTVAPKLYVALGISGAIQHLVGMKGSRVVVAINKDASAPIFEVADYGIAGDLMEVVPALTEAIRQAKE